MKEYHFFKKKTTLFIIRLITNKLNVKKELFTKFRPRPLIIRYQDGKTLVKRKKNTTYK